MAQEERRDFQFRAYTEQGDKIEVNLSCTEEAFNLLKMNVRRKPFDPGRMRGHNADLQKENRLWTRADLEGVLLEGMSLFTGYEPDGPQRSCTVCDQMFQPRVITRESDDGEAIVVGGNFYLFKAKTLEKLVEGVDGKDEIMDRAETLTQEAFGNEKPSDLFMFTACEGCRDLFNIRWGTYANKKAEGPELAGKWKLGDLRKQISRNLPQSQRNPNSSDHRGRPTGFGGNNDRQDRQRNWQGRPKPTLVNWNGVSLHERTANELTEAGYDLESAREAVQNGSLIGDDRVASCHPGSIGAISMAFQRAEEDESVEGDVTVVSQLKGRRQQGAGADAPKPNKKSKTLKVQGSSGKVLRKTGAAS
ncbi:MAG: hypothetical protein COV29_04260 [Candidatus Yanofskybacteria bacterium CG10_big_fil_rev_8_21_14_0_10_36_16]|uniref:Uncharacterized protein n=1 Tax=Candidatus Yanofskybacteria bacterium CG10_big_fil_rev_8_21_14_0_10_36_16 TaxID=1975096 RepID=A0A2J0Q6D7_9BACT|nr:MAG: hypothetical protein COV29_04260 [Candidatus Yanofskybacteria bacterium CG10_big_fil_rev_8_21_14_0_10_36_16]